MKTIFKASIITPLLLAMFFFSLKGMEEEGIAIEKLESDSIGKMSTIELCQYLAGRKNRLEQIRLSHQIADGNALKMYCIGDEDNIYNELKKRNVIQSPNELKEDCVPDKDNIYSELEKRYTEEFYTVQFLKPLGYGFCFGVVFTSALVYLNSYYKKCKAKKKIKKEELQCPVVAQSKDDLLAYWQQLQKNAQKITAESFIIFQDNIAQLQKNLADLNMKLNHIFYTKVKS